MRLIIGLGNPGREYAETRHNIGFEVVDALAGRLNIADNGGFDRLARSKFSGLMLDGVVGDEKVVLLKPTTFMNLSGQSVRAAMDFYRIAPSEIMVVLDDLALPVGKIRLRANGSSGGHNGLRDIERVLGNSDYPRLRIGIDAPPPNVPAKAYVLSRWSAEQSEAKQQAIARACEAILTWIQKGITPAMNVFNADEKL